MTTIKTKVRQSNINIVASIYLLLFFTKIKLQSTIINKIGKAAFAAFLLHAVMMT